MYRIGVKMSRNGVDWYTTTDEREANRIIETATEFGRPVMAWKDGEKIFDSVNA